MAQTGVYSKKIISAGSALNTVGVVGPSIPTQDQEVSFTIAWGTGVSAGAVKIESAPDENYTGTWAVFATVTYVSGAPICDVVQITGNACAYRARISTAITGGTVDVTFVGN